ncbi:MAG: PQQ-binding-like beta-propeller repeat protein, partial [bacterium]
MRQVITFFALLCVPLAGITGDWITGGGNAARNAISDEIGPSSPETLWEVSSPAWFGNQMFIEGDKLVTRRYQSPYTVPIYCYDLDNGDLLWNLNLPGAFQSLPLGIRDGQVYALKYLETGLNTLYALNAADGSIIWQVEVPELDYFYSPESA